MRKLLSFAFFVGLFLNQAVLAQDSPLQNLLKYDAASVELERGCSGTIICQRLVITAAHCRTTGQRVTVILRDGRRIPGRVIKHDKSIDVAIIRLDTTEKLPSIDIASDYPPDGVEMLLYGDTYGAGKIRRFRANVKYQGDGGWLDLYSNTSAIAGESGGGGFYNGKYYGTIARCDDLSAGGSWTGLSPTPGTRKLVASVDCKCPS